MSNLKGDRKVTLKHNNEITITSGKDQDTDKKITKPQEQLKADEEIRAAKDLVKLYYEKFGKQQFHLVARLYTEDAISVRDGVSAQGQDNIAKLFGNLPVGNFRIDCIDVQVLGAANEFIIVVAGSVKYPKQSLKFVQNLITKIVGKNYKIMRDNFRHPELSCVRAAASQLPDINLIMK